MPEEVVVYKILRPSEWAALRREGRFCGSADDLRDGFIHLSSGAQVEGTLARHFSNDGDREVVLVAVSVDALGENLRWETSRGGAPFPHLHAQLMMGDVLESWRLSREVGGAYTFPEGFG